MTWLKRLFERPSTRKGLAGLPLSREEARSGIGLIGMTGSAKTSIIELLVDDLLRLERGIPKPGCVWCTVKPDDTDRAIRILTRCGREDDIIVLSPGRSGLYNLLQFALRQTGGTPENAARLFQDLNTVLRASRGSNHGEAFWENLFETTLIHAIGVAQLARPRDYTIEDVMDLIMTSPATIAAAASEPFLQTKCGSLLQFAARHAKTKSEERRASQAAAFFMEFLPGVGEKARGAVLAYVAGILGPFLQHPLFDCCCTGTSNVNPSDPLRGKCVVLDMPLLANPLQGRLLQLAFVQQTIEATLARKVGNDSSDVVVIRDEYQLLNHPLRDAMAQSVARSQKLTSVIAFQSNPVLESALGAGDKAKTDALALLDCHATKLLLAQNCPETCEFNAKLCGHSRRMFVSTSEGDPRGGEWLDQLYGIGGSPRMSLNQTWHYNVPPNHWHGLRTGGRRHGFMIDAVMHQGGRTFANGKPYLHVSFQQRILP